MKVNIYLARLGACGTLLLGASCAPSTKDAAASKQEAIQVYERKWQAEKKRQQELAAKEAEAKREYYAEYIRQHGYPTHADRDRAIREALKSSGASPGR